MKIFLLTAIAIFFSVVSFSQNCDPGEVQDEDGNCYCPEGSCKNLSGQCVDVTLGECTVGSNEAADPGIGGHCYTTSIFSCPGGGYQVQCNFTGVYGAPISCTSVGCGPLGAIPHTRRCVRR